MRVWAQSSHRSTCPPSAAVRQTSIAVMTRRWARLRCAAFAARHASPWRRKISATSNLGLGIAGASGRRCLVDVQKVEWALNLPDGIERHPRVPGGRRDMPVPQQVLDHPDIDALLQERGGEAVPQCMNSDLLVETRGVSGAPAGALHGTRRDGMIKIRAGKEPMRRASTPP